METEIIEAEILEPLPPMKPTDGKCMARRKQGRGYCQQFGMANGRCARHGGKSLSGIAHANYIDGRSGKAQYLPPHLTARMEGLNKDAIANLEESILIQQSLETKLLEQLKTGESSVLWGQLRTIISETRLKIADLHRKMQFEEEMPEGYVESKEQEFKALAFEEMEEVVIEGKNRYAVQVELRKQVQVAHDYQRKLTETLTKSRKEIQETYTQEQWYEMLNMLMLDVKSIVTHEQLMQLGKLIEARQPKQLTD